jgi:hypothetical protein
MKFGHGRNGVQIERGIPKDGDESSAYISIVKRNHLELESINTLDNNPNTENTLTI